MNRQTLIVLGGGLCAALLVALLMQAMVGSKKPVSTDTVAPVTQVLVAAKDLKIGDTLEPASYKWQDWPENSVFQGAIVKSSIPEDAQKTPLTGRLKRSVSIGEPIMQSLVVEEEKGNFVAATLSPGMRAMAIKVKAESSVGGFLSPNDHVDVILTYDLRLPSDERVRDASATVINRRAAQTILENVRIVAVDQKAKEIEKVAVARTVTLEVNPRQAEQLALAEAMGTLSLALRRIGDNSTQFDGDKIPESTTDIRMSNVMQELLGNENSAGVQSRVVRVYNGAASQDIVVRPYTAQ